MTPSALLSLALTQFPVMYLSPAIQGNLLKQAIGTYQDKAGIIRKLHTPTASATTPADLLEIVNVTDAEGRWHEATVGATAITIVAQTRKSVAPYDISYFANLRDMDIEKDELPSESIGILRDYLEVLIAIPNTARARNIAQATGLQTEFPTEEELRTRKENLELSMEDMQAIIPMATVY